MPVGISGLRGMSWEVWEAKTPMVVECADYAPDSAGAGRFRGGAGIDFAVTALRDMDLTVVNERSQVPPFALGGGGTGRCNQVLVHAPDGTIEQHTKVTGLHVPEGTRIEVRTGGGAAFRPARAAAGRRGASRHRRGLPDRGWRSGGATHAF